MTAPDEPLVRALVAVSRGMVGLAVRSLATLDADVTLPQYRTLVVLTTSGARRSAELAGEMCVAPSTMTRMCDRLARKDLLRREHRAGDRRSTWIEITPAGRRLVGTVMRARQQDIATLVREAGLVATTESLALLSAFTAACCELPDEEWWRRWAQT